MTWAPTHGCALALLLPKRATKGSSKSTITTLEKILSPTSKVQWRRDAASVWSLCDGDPLKLSEWCLRRLEMGLYEQPGS